MTTGNGNRTRTRKSKGIPCVEELRGENRERDDDLDEHVTETREGS
jgi:hypothetical protein